MYRGKSLQHWKACSLQSRITTKPSTSHLCTQSNQVTPLIQDSTSTLRITDLLRGHVRLRVHVLTLMQHQMVLLEERLAALAGMRSHRALSVRMTPCVLDQAVLRREPFVTVRAEVRLGLRHHLAVHLWLLLHLLLLLLLLHLLMHDRLRLDNRLLLLGCLYLVVVLHYRRVLLLLLLLGTLLHGHRLADHLSVRGQDLYRHRVGRHDRGIRRDHRNSWK